MAGSTSVPSVVQPSFGAGEVSPTMFGRVDLAKYKVGLALCRNFFVDYRGGASNRAGTKFVDNARQFASAVRLIPFKFSVAQQYVLEFSNIALRFIRNGGFLLEASKTISSITLASPGVFTSTAHGFSNNDSVSFNITGGMPQLHGRSFFVTAATANTFQVYNNFGVLLDTSAFTAFTAGTVARIYTISTPYLAADLAMLKFTQTEDVMTITHQSYQQRKLTRLGDINWTLAVINMAISATTPAAPTVASTTTFGANTRYSYCVTSINEFGEESLPSRPTEIMCVNISTTLGTNTITWVAIPGAVSYNVYKAQYAGGPNVSSVNYIPVGQQHGYIASVFGLEFKDGNVVPDFTKTPPIEGDPFAQSSIKELTVTAGGSGYTDGSGGPTPPTVTITGSPGTGAEFRAIVIGGILTGFYKISGGRGYVNPIVSFSGGGTGSGAAATATTTPATGTWPGVVSTFQQRKVFASTFNAPSTIFGSVSGLFDNFASSIPVIATDAYSFKLSSNEINNIKHMIAMPGGLVVLTEGGAWQISGGEQGGPVTPTQIKAEPQAFNGCSDVPPIVVNYEVLYVQALGTSVRNLSYNFFANIYTGTDMSVLANHLFDGLRILEWCYAEDPFKVIWAVRSDGKLLSFTFLKEQEVFAWARHDTQGQVKSICSVIEGNENVVYMVVKRKLGANWVQYIERLASRLMNNGIGEAWFLDCALERPLVYPAASITPSGTSGSINILASAAVFAAGDVGKVVRFAGAGIGTVTAFINSTNITVSIIQAPTDLLIDGTPVEGASGTWSMTSLVTSVSGLWHLEGKDVVVFADGQRQAGTKTVTSGAISGITAASRVLVGLPIQAQLQTLPLDIGEPTQQGKRKVLHGLTTKVNNTLGLKFGPNFNTLYAFPVVANPIVGLAPAPVSGEEYSIMSPVWKTVGQMCFQQDEPLPVSILSVIPEVLFGDDEK